MASGGAPEPLKCQTLVLRVSIHCESCNKKVKRILDRIDGVHHTDIDSRRNKVTVTASINAETLIKKLHKAGKHAELWPELKPLKTPNSPNPNPKSNNNNNKEKTSSSNPSEPKPPSSDSALVSTNPAASLAEKIESAAAKKPSETAKASETTSNPDTATTIKADTEALKITNNKDSTNSETTDSASTSTSPEKTTENKIERSASSGKINGKKIHKDTSSVTGEENSVDSTPPENPHTPQQPLPVVHAYNIIHPSASYAYYATTSIPQGYPPPEPYRYYRDYSEQPLPEFYHRTMEYSSMGGGYYGTMDPELMLAPPEGHYHMFSDENANACKVM